MYQISNKDYDEIVEYLSVFARMTYHNATSGDKLRLYNQGRRASILVSKLIRKSKVVERKSDNAVQG